MRNRHILIVAKDARQGAKYAKNAGLPNFTYRVVRSASSITGIQSVDVHLIDGFEARPDAGAILARLRWARDIAYYSTSMPPEPVKDEGDGMGEQLALMDHAIQLDKNLITLADDPELTELVEERIERTEQMKDALTSSEPAAESLDHVVPSDDAAEQAPKKRRKRCKTCGRLTAAPFEEEREGHDEAAHSSQSLFA